MPNPKKNSLRIAIRQSLIEIQGPPKAVTTKKKENKSKENRKVASNYEKSTKVKKPKTTTKVKTKMVRKKAKIQDVQPEPTLKPDEENMQIEEDLKSEELVEDDFKIDPRRLIDMNLKVDFDKLKIQNVEEEQDTDDMTSNKNLKIISWCLDGVNKLVGEKALDFLQSENADIICLQNLKISDVKEAKEKLGVLNGMYNSYFNLKCWMPGIAVLSKVKPLIVKIKTNLESLDNSLMILEFHGYLLVCVHAPSSGPGLCNLKKKLKWLEDFKELVHQLMRDQKPFVIAGNFQTSLQEIDVAEPKYSRFQPGFTKEESELLSGMLEIGLIDTFRMFHPSDFEGFTYFTNHASKGHVQEQGSRVDYFFVSKELQGKVLNSDIKSEVVNYTHSPIELILT